MNIIYQKWKFLNSTKKYTPLQVRKLYTFGLETLVARSIVSFRANARLVPGNWYTAKSKIYRLLSNKRIPNIFLTLLVSLHLVGEKDSIAVDFSDFGNGFQVLMFAKQTKRGRAIPLYFEILQYPIQEHSQNIFIINTIKHFYSTIGCTPRLVFDRGFACPDIIKFLAQNNYIFIIRIKKGKSASRLSNRKMFVVKNNRRNDEVVYMHSLRLRLLVSDHLEHMKEPWFLVTNDFRSSRKKIINHYYHRFEIEEFFRDAKRLLNLEHVTCEKELSLTTSLWFAILGVWFFHSLEETMDEHAEEARIAMQLSRIRYFFERVYGEYVRVTEGKYVALDKKRLKR
jgi:hypothetical protein